MKIGHLDGSARASISPPLALGWRAVVISALLCSGCAGPASATSPSEVGASPEATARAGEPDLDELLAQAWAAARVQPAPLADDATYLRRVTLDLTGRVPTAAEVDEFLADVRPDKRARLVDRLLSSEDYADYWAELYLDLMIGNDVRARRLVEDDARVYLREALAEDRGWDQMVREMITAQGASAEDGAAAFLIAHLERGNSGVANLTAATGEKLLGVQIQCAQCHDHPYDDFTREDFWAMSAFYARTRVRVDREGGGDRPRFHVAEKRRGEARIAEEGEVRERVVRPAFLGRPLEVGADEDRRARLAREVTGSDLFAKAAVGRLWTWMFSRGIVEPWNDLGGEGRAHAPALELLAAEFRASGHSQRALLRKIALSSAYQRSSSGPEAGRAEAEEVFARAAVRPLSAEQLFGALLDVTGLEQVSRLRFRATVQRRKRAALREFTFVFADDEMGEADAFSGNVPQALLLLNGGLTNQGSMAHPGGTLDAVLSAHDTTDARVDALFRAVYARPASAEERAWAAGFVGQAGDERAELGAWEDLMFAMLYSSEFLTNH